MVSNGERSVPTLHLPVFRERTAHNPQVQTRSPVPVPARFFRRFPGPRPVPRPTAFSGPCPAPCSTAFSGPCPVPCSTAFSSPFSSANAFGGACVRAHMRDGRLPSTQYPPVHSQMATPPHLANVCARGARLTCFLDEPSSLRRASERSRFFCERIRRGVREGAHARRAAPVHPIPAGTQPNGYASPSR